MYFFPFLLTMPPHGFYQSEQLHSDVPTVLTHSIGILFEDISFSLLLFEGTADLQTSLNHVGDVVLGVIYHLKGDLCTPFNENVGLVHILCGRYPAENSVGIL